MAHSPVQRKKTPDFCEVCRNKRLKIQRHHIKGRRHGGSSGRGNLIALCPNDHQLADNKEYTAVFLYEIVADRLERELEAGDLTVDAYVRAQNRITAYLQELEELGAEVFPN